ARGPGSAPARSGRAGSRGGTAGNRCGRARSWSAPVALKKPHSGSAASWQQ
nr:hypothetical protein [Tanacetum cinerariifolium]